MVSAHQEWDRPLAVITGASSGIGEAFARRLAKAGYDLVLVARRKDRLENLAAHLRESHGAQVEALPADLTKDDALAQVESRIRRAGNLEFLVNNAGFGTRQLFYEADAQSQDQMHRLHVLATLRLTRAALPVLLARKKGYIVNVSSMAAFVQGPYNVSYCASKAWVNSFTEGVYLELRAMKTGVKVQALCPGFIKTEFHQRMGIDRSFISSSWWMPPEAVVEASLEGLRRDRLIVVPGARYKLLVWAVKLIPRRVLYAFAARMPNVRARRAASAK